MAGRSEGGIPAYPLAWPDGWPRARHRKDARFSRHGGRLSIEEAVKRVRQELERLGVDVANDMIVSSNLQLNLRGLPRGNQGEPGDAGAAVYWQARGKPMRVMAIDTYNRVADNLGAVAATLEAMRAIERHGGAQILDRAFTGFAALPAPGSRPVRPWREVFGIASAGPIKAENIEAAFRRLAKARHPDVAGGSSEAMAELNRARDEALREVSGG